jgi:hypothetical protein
MLLKKSWNETQKIVSILNLNLAKVGPEQFASENVSANNAISPNALYQENMIRRI